MSGIVGSRFNIRGSGLVGSLGTDGQVFTSSGAGKSAVFEAAGGGKVLQVQFGARGGGVSTDSATPSSLISVAITPASSSNYLWVISNMGWHLTDHVSETDACFAKHYIYDGSTYQAAGQYNIRDYTSMNNSALGNLTAFWSPNTTSEVTIQLMHSTGTDTGRIFTTGHNSESPPYNNTCLTVMEIEA